MGAGSVWSTTGGVAKWDAALAARSLLSETSWQAVLARHVAIDDPAEGASPVRTDGYGYGWFTAVCPACRCATTQATIRDSAP